MARLSSGRLSHVGFRTRSVAAIRGFRQATRADRLHPLLRLLLHGNTALIGVIIAHVQLASADALLSTHCRFQIRTFWIGLLYLAIGIILTTAVVGIAVLFWWFIWSLVRNVKGVLALNENKPIANPSSWLFG
jgi:uncharacterized membrane protein